MTPFDVNILALGNWNKKLFTPEWVSSNLFNLPAGATINGSINPAEYEFTFLHQGIAILPKDVAVEIKIEKIDQPTIELANLIFARLLRLLPHTPVKGVGFNVRYRIPVSQLGDFIEAPKWKLFGDGNTNLNLIRYSKDTLEYRLNYVLDNFAIHTFDITFNFHYSSRPQVMSASFKKAFELTDVIINKKTL